MMAVGKGKLPVANLAHATRELRDGGGVPDLDVRLAEREAHETEKGELDPLIAAGKKTSYIGYKHKGACRIHCEAQKWIWARFFLITTCREVYAEWQLKRHGGTEEEKKKKEEEEKKKKAAEEKQKASMKKGKSKKKSKKKKKEGK